MYNEKYKFFPGKYNYLFIRSKTDQVILDSDKSYIYNLNTFGTYMANFLKACWFLLLVDSL